MLSLAAFVFGLTCLLPLQTLGLYIAGRPNQVIKADSEKRELLQDLVRVEGNETMN